MNTGNAAPSPPQFRLKTLFVFVTCVAVAIWLFRPPPKPLAERWSESSARTEEALIDEFGPPDPVEKDLVEKLREFKLKGMTANARWLQWTDPDEPQRCFIAVVVDGKAWQRLDVQIRRDGKEMKIRLFSPFEDTF
jgi:hypothetical protein